MATRWRPWRQYVELRYRPLPCLYSVAHECMRKARPVRPLVFDCIPATLNGGLSFLAQHADGIGGGGGDHAQPIGQLDVFVLLVFAAAPASRVINTSFEVERAVLESLF